MNAKLTNIIDSLAKLAGITVVFAVLSFVVYAGVTLSGDEDSAAPVDITQTDATAPINGINVLYYHPEIEDLESYTNDFVRRIVGLSATDMAIAIPFFMESNSSSQVITTAETPSVDEVKLLVDAAQKLGVKPTIKPLVDGLSSGFERQEITPTNVDGWFASYLETIQPYIELSENESLESFVVGVELSSIQNDSDRWRQLVADVRSTYSGELTYAANWDAPEVPFADVLDFVGIDAYFPYEGDVNNTDLKAFWEQTLNDLPYTDNPNYVVHEYGITSHVGAEQTPWQETLDGDPDPGLQSEWLRAACDVIHQRTRGGYMWVVYFGTDLGSDDPQDTGYNLIGKPVVEDSVRDCFNWY